MSPILIVKRGVVSPTLFVIPCNFFLRIVDLQCCNYCQSSSDSHPTFKTSVTIFHHKLLAREKVGFDQWMNSCIIHDNTCSLILTKCHPKRHHGGLKYHMTLTMLSSVLIHVLSF